jgi:hypothetical protein
MLSAGAAVVRFGLAVAPQTFPRSRLPPPVRVRVERPAFPPGPAALYSSNEAFAKRYGRGGRCVSTGNGRMTGARIDLIAC